MQIDISKFGKGALVPKPDIRNYRYELIAGAVRQEEEFEGESAFENVKDQGKSSSCVGQAIAEYAQVLNFIETGEKLEFSARDIYSKVCLPAGGAYTKDALKKWINEGIVKEQDAVSYEGGNPPSEEFMRKRDDITKSEQEAGMPYAAKEYYTWDNTNFDIYRQAIRAGKGCPAIAKGNNVCWKKADLEVPTSESQCTWAHQILFISSKVYIRNGVEALKFLNHWGKDWGDFNYGYMPREYIEKGLVVFPCTVLDRPNTWYANTIKYISILKNLIDLWKKLLALKGRKTN